MNSQGDGQDESYNPLGTNTMEQDNNVIPFKVPRKQQIPSLDQGKQTPSDWQKPFDLPLNREAGRTPKERLLNLPPLTAAMLGLLIGVHLVITFLLPEDWAQSAFVHLGFIPGRFTGAAIFQPIALLTPFTHMLLHGGWLHLAMNSVMLLAFGSGIEKWNGAGKMLALFIGSGLCGVLVHFALNFESIHPVIGASGGLSGLFAAALIMMNRLQGGSPKKIAPFILLWIGISVLLGMMGSPDGGQIAWAAHVGGFMGGFLMIRVLKF